MEINKEYRLLWLQTTLSIVCVVLLYLLAIRYNTMWDYSDTEEHTLSPTTIDVLTHLEQPLHITLFIPNSSPAKASTMALVPQILATNPNISLEYIDPETNPLQATAHEIDTSTYATMLLELLELKQGDGKTKTHKIENDLSERNILQGLLILLSTKPHNICFTQGQGEWDMEDQESLQGVGLLIDRLHESNYNSILVHSQTILGIETDENPLTQGCDLLVLPSPKNDFSREYLDILESYWNNNGKTIILMDPQISLPNLEHSLGNYGIVLHDDIILEFDPSLQISGGDPSFLIVPPTQVINASINQGQNLLLQGARSIDITAAITEYTPTTIAHSSVYSWGEKTISEEDPKPDADEMQQNVPFMVSFSKPQERPQFITIGTSSLLRNQFVQANPYNATFFLNLLSFQLQEDKQIAARYTPPANNVRLSTEQFVIILLICLVIAPFSIAIGAFFTWRERRPASK